MEITELQYQFIMSKYERLLWKIAHWISGDVATASLADNYQDLCLKVVEATVAYASKVGNPISEILETEGYGKYLKTCLWNCKNHKGINLKKRYHIQRDSVSLSKVTGIVEAVPYDGSMRMENVAFFNELQDILPERSTRVLKAVMSDPSIIKKNGRININAVATVIGVTWHDAFESVQILQSKVERELNE